MSIVKIRDYLHESLRIASQAFDRSLNGQAEHWMKVGMIAEMYPELTYRQIMKRLLEDDLANPLTGGMLNDSHKDRRRSAKL